MELDWSEQSRHIRTLFRPWQAGDGYDEAAIVAAEGSLGVRLPATLRSFYRTWGRRQDLVGRREYLMPLNGLVVRADTLIFCLENQATLYWAVRREALEETNPPVIVASAQKGQSVQDVELPLTWRPSHANLSMFLDDLTYRHAFAQGAIHGGLAAQSTPEAHQVAWLEQHWSKATVTPMYFGLVSGFLYDLPPLYVRNGQARTWISRCTIAAGSDEALDEIAQALQIIWSKRW